MSVIARVAWAAERAIYALSAGAERVARAGRPSSTKLTQFQPDNQALWSVDAILNALQEHEDGDFGQSAKLAAAMGRDDRISACRNTRTRALVGRNGATFSVVPSTEGDQRRSASVCDQVRSLWTRCFTESVVTRILSDVIDLGVSISRIHWERSEATGKQWLPRLEPWDMRWIRWDHFRGCYIALSEQGETEVRPGTGEWLIIEPSGARSWMAGGVRALAMPFFFRGMTWKDWARYCEKHGVPILAIEEPPAKGDPATEATKASFFARLKRIGREGILRLPMGADGKNGYGARILEPSTLSWPAFEAFLKRLDVCIAIFLLGQNLSTEVQGGSLAASVSQNRVRLDYLAADAESLSTSFREQVLMFWGRFNFDWWNDAITPWPTWDTSEPEDVKTKSATLVNVATALDKLKKATSPVDERALLEQYGIPLLTVQEVEKAAAELAKKAVAAKPADTAKPADAPADNPPAESPPAEEKK